MASPRVCVIGAGSAGLTTIKQLKDQGITNIDCFEVEEEVAGIFNHGVKNNGVYDNTYLTISNYFMAFSDLPPTGHRFHWHHTEYKAYLVEYADKFDLRRHVHFRTRVVTVEGEPGKWHVVVKSEDECSEPKDMGHYDGVAVCSGSHQQKKGPQIAGIETFTGTMLHSDEYKNNAKFANKNCVVVGIGESAADIVREISDVSSACTLVWRTPPFLIPRITRTMFAHNPLGAPSDAFSTRCHHDVFHTCDEKYSGIVRTFNRAMVSFAAVMYYFFPRLGSHIYNKQVKDGFNQDNETKRFIDLDSESSEAVDKYIWDVTLRSGKSFGWNPDKFATKNVSWVPNVIKGKIVVNETGIKCVDGDYVVFNDDARARADYLVTCTGYRDNFHFLKGNVGDTGVPLTAPDGNVRKLFKHIFHPGIGASMAWIGFVRPSTGGIPACSELAARYFAQLMAGKKQLPKNYKEITDRDYEIDTKYFALSGDLKTVTNYKMWAEEMANLIGCSVQLWRYILQPRLFIHICLGSYLPSQFRLQGPNALPELSKKTILSQPVAQTPVEVMFENMFVWRRYLRSQAWMSRTD